MLFLEKKGCDSQRNFWRSKLANVWLDIISKINYKKTVVMLYTSLKLEWNKIKLVC